MLKATSAKFSFIEIWFTNPDNKPLEIEDSVNITLLIGAESKALISKNLCTV